MEEVLFTESFLSGLGKVSSTLQGKNNLADGKTTKSTAQKPKICLFFTVAVLFKTKPNTSKTFLTVHEEMRVFCSLFHLFPKFNIFTCIYDSSLNCISRAQCSSCSLICSHSLPLSIQGCGARTDAALSETRPDQAFTKRD